MGIRESIYAHELFLFIPTSSGIAPCSSLTHPDSTFYLAAEVISALRMETVVGGEGGKMKGDMACSCGSWFCGK